MGCGAASLCNLCLTFLDNLLVSSTMVEMSKKNEFTRFYRNGGHPLPSVSAPYLKRTVTSVGKIVEFSGLGLIWDNIPEFVSRDWGKPRRTRVYVVCWSRFAPLTFRIRIRRAVYPTATCDDLWLGIRKLRLSFILVLVCRSCCASAAWVLNTCRLTTVACKLTLMYVRRLYSVFSVHYIQTV